jgi:voltage-gated potassium channel
MASDCFRDPARLSPVGGRGWHPPQRLLRLMRMTAGARVGAVILARLQVVVILAALITVPLTFAEIQGQNGVGFNLADWIIWALFAIEYLLALALAHDRRRYVLTAWLPLLVVLVSFPLLPTVFAVLRAGRLVRLFRLARLIAVAARAAPAIKAALGRSTLLYMLALFLLIVTVAGAVMSVVEPQTVKGNMWDGVWWAVVTATTVGYGDISPSSLGGRSIAAILMLLGIGVTATLAASVAAYFVDADRSHDTSDVASRLDRIERLLADLMARSERSEREP